MVIKQILCDKCGRKIADDKAHPRLCGMTVKEYISARKTK